MSDNTRQKEIPIIGAGIIGVTTALEAQERGHKVYLIDRKAPGQETSFGNAGVLSDSSVYVINNPELPKKLAQLLFRRNPSVRIDPHFILRNFSWFMRFLSHSTWPQTLRSSQALHKLLSTSLALHQKRIKSLGLDNILNQRGWIRLFRSQNAFDSCRKEFALLEQLGIRFRTIPGDEISDLEPALMQKFYAAVLFEDALSIASPWDLVQAYFDQFQKLGGQFIHQKVTKIHTSKTSSPNENWQINLQDGGFISVNDCVIAAGPWSADIVKSLGYKVPLSWERGYHLHLTMNDHQKLRRPVLDYERGYVLSPQKDRIRVLTGVELTHRDAPLNNDQIKQAVAEARQIINAGDILEDTPWLGSRPVLPDSLPCIGPAPTQKHLWFNFGHQHIGMASSTGSAELLCDLLEGVPPKIDGSSFRPNRFRTSSK